MEATAARVRQILNDAVAEGQLPGAAAVIGTAHARSEVITAGVRRLSGPPVTADTRYDLASLTKVVATLPTVLGLCADGAITLDDPVRRFISNAGWFQKPSLGDATVRQLLTHTSGLEAWRPVYAHTSDRLTALGNVLQSPIGAPGAIVYSDLGFITLGAIVERVTRQRLDAVVRARVLEPLGLRATGFGPVGPPVAATEDCGWRNTVLEGVVHDENAFRLDGVAGHAGLFGTADDVATYAQAWLTLDPRLGDPARLADARRLHVDDGTVRRGLGWLLRGVDPFGGPRSTAAGFGHTGFVGTSVWIEPDDGWFAVLLTNRVHPSRSGGSAMHRIRRAVHDAAGALSAGR